MLKKINIYLAAVAVVGILFCGCTYVYTHFAKLENTKIVQQLEGGL